MYCTREDMVTRFSESELVALTDRDGSEGGIVDSVLEQAIHDAGATIDGYIGGRYRLPLSVVPSILLRMCCDLARYYLYDDQLGDEHQVTKRYNNAVKYLEQLGSGRVQLGVDQDSSRPTTTATAEIMSAGSVFGRNSAKGFI